MICFVPALAAVDPNLLARCAGSVAFGVATGACLLAWRAAARSPASRDGWLWLLLALGYALLVVDLQLNLRFMLERWLEARAGHAGVYASRRPVQMAALLVVLAAELVLLAGPVRRIGRGNRLLGIALAGASLNGLALLAEIVSLHAMDALLYARLGAMLLIVLVWLAGAGVVSVAALWGVRSSAPIRRVP